MATDYFPDYSNSNYNPYATDYSNSNQSSLNPYSGSSYNYGYTDSTDYGNLYGDDVRFAGSDTDLNSGYDSSFYAGNTNYGGSSRGGGGGSAGENQGLFGIKWGELLGGLAGGVGNFLGGNKAAKAQAKIQQDRLNFEMQKEAARIKERNDSINRRFGGIESDVMSDAASVYRDLRNLAPDAGQLRNIGRDIQTNLRPAVTQSGQLVNDLFSGQQLSNRLDDATAAAQARSNVAIAQARGIDVGLQQTLARIAAQNAARGFTGTSSAQEARLARDIVPARAAALTAGAQAEFENAEMLRQIREDNYLRQLQNIGLPYSLAENQFAFETFPEEAARNAVARSLAVRGASFDSLRAGDVTPGLPFGGTSGSSIFSEPIVRPGFDTVLSSGGDIISEYYANQAKNQAIRDRQTSIETGGQTVR